MPPRRASAASPHMHAVLSHVLFCRTTTHSKQQTWTLCKHMLCCHGHQLGCTPDGTPVQWPWTGGASIA